MHDDNRTQPAAFLVDCDSMRHRQATLEPMPHVPSLYASSIIEARARQDRSRPPDGRTANIPHRAKLCSVIRNPPYPQWEDFRPLAPDTATPRRRGLQTDGPHPTVRQRRAHRLEYLRIGKFGARVLKAELLYPSPLA